MLKHLYIVYLYICTFAYLQRSRKRRRKTEGIEFLVQENNAKGMWRKLKTKDVMKEKKIDYSWRERNINRMYVTQKKKAGEKEICALKSKVKENWKKLLLKPPTDTEYWIRRLCTATNVVSSAAYNGRVIQNNCTPNVRFVFKTASSWAHCNIYLKIELRNSDFMNINIL